MPKDKLHSLLIDCVRNVLTGKLKKQNESWLNETLIELGANSFDVVRIINMMEDLLKIELLESTLQDVMRHLFQLLMTEPISTSICKIHHYLDESYKYCVHPQIVDSNDTMVVYTGQKRYIKGMLKLLNNLSGILYS